MQGSFRDARNWSGLHTPANLAKSISIEAAELLEIFQWSNGDGVTFEQLNHAADELADVLIYSLSFAAVAGFDVAAIIRAKMESNAIKYPAPAAAHETVKTGSE